jgi:hypothetical protein
VRCKPGTFRRAYSMVIKFPSTDSSNDKPMPESTVPASDSLRPPNTRLRHWPAPVQQAFSFLERKESMLWWLHSVWALLFGLCVMWLGSKNFTYLRIIVFQISFIWLSSLFLPVLINRSWFSPVWRERVRLVVNYFNKNFYQQLLFFLLPIYYASTTLGSRNMVFLVILSISALLSTLDIFYDRYLSVRWQLSTIFFAFNLFASINVMLPLLWSVNHRWALWISAILALIGFDSMIYRLSGLAGRSAKLLLGGAAIALLLMITIFAPFIPPAPLALASSQFGKSVRSLRIVGPLDTIPETPGTICVMTAIKAPLGLEEGVRHRWYLNGEQIFVSKDFSFTGGNKDGYRIWTQITWNKDFHGNILTVDVETKNGQLIGRSRLSK